MEEIWKDVKGFEGLYSVSNLGRVKNRFRILSRINNKNEYVSITLCNKGYHKPIRIHRLIAITFIPNPENKPTVNHINGIKTDNRVENLEWATYLEQTRHASISGLMNIINLSGEKARNFRLSDNEVSQIREKYKTGNFSYSQLALQYKTCKSHVGRIVKNKLRA